MWSYILKRMLLMIPTLLGALAITFGVIQFVPGGPVEQMVAQLRGQGGGGGEAAGSSGAGYRGRQGVDAAQIEEIKKLYGFDKPPHERFVQMVVSFAKFDLGKSFFHHQDVWGLIKEKLPVSITLGLWTFVLSYLISVPLGIAKAVRAGSRFDLVTSIIALRGLTSPNWDELSLWGKVVDYLWHIALPVTASVVGSFATLTMLTKNAFLEEIRKQYVITARAKGLEERRVLWKHVFRNALIPIITGFPAAFIGAFFTGALLIETLFSLDGLGLLGYESVIRRDYPVVLGTFYLFTLIGLLTKLVSDLCYVWVDPRVKFD
jgi:microcin C transport system permease protein